jgi:hypothetical protein
MARTLPPRIQALFADLEEAVLGMATPTSPQDELEEPRPLSAIYAATLLRGYAERWQETAVRAARADYSWKEIARPLGTSRQSAHERFRGSL